MTNREWLDKLQRDMQKLRHNREKVPLNVLKTRYARAYNTLVAELECDADWFAGADRNDSEAEKRAYRSALIDKMDYSLFVTQAILFHDRKQNKQLSLFPGSERKR